MQSQYSLYQADIGSGVDSLHECLWLVVISVTSNQVSFFHGTYMQLVFIIIEAALISWLNLLC